MYQSKLIAKELRIIKTHKIGRNNIHEQFPCEAFNLLRSLFQFDYRNVFYFEMIINKAMFFYSNAFRITAFIFILVTVLIILIKPALFFDNDGQLKSFGLTYSEQTTPLPFCAFIYGFLILLYMIIIFIDSHIFNL